MTKQIARMIVLAAALTLVSADIRSGLESIQGVKMKSGYISVPDGRLYYEDAGQGPCIVFIHDGMLHSEAYDPQFAAFAGDHRVVRYDRRGYGRSDSPKQLFSDIADLKAVFDTLKIDSALLVGCSAGSLLSIDFTLAYPQHVTGLVLMGPVVSGMAYTNHMLTRGGRMTQAIRADSVQYRRYWIESDPYEFYPGNTEAKERARSILTACPQNLNAQNTRFDRGPDRPAAHFLSEIKVPTLIVVGEGDIPDVHAHAGAIEAGISGARREVISQAGHLVPLEKPQEVTDLIRSFVFESAFFNTISREGVPAAIRAYRTLLAQQPAAKPLAEDRLNQLGYQSLQGGKTADALELFKLAIDIYPNSFNVYDSYGEALLASGDTTQAIVNYKRSLELNPNNTNAAQVLLTLQGK